MYLFLALACLLDQCTSHGGHWLEQRIVGGPAENGLPGTACSWLNRAQPLHLRSWQMNRSTVCYFVGNDTAGNSASEYAGEARFGSVGVGWELKAIQSNKSHLEQWELETAKTLKAIRPDIRVLVTRNIDCGGTNWDKVKTAIEEHPEYFLRNPDGTVYKVPWVASPAWNPQEPHQSYWFPAAYFNYSLPEATEWWLNTFVGGALQRPEFDGVYWDACGPSAPPVKPAGKNWPCPGCKYPPPLVMSPAEQAAYFVAANAAFSKAEEMARNTSKWLTNARGKDWGTGPGRKGNPIGQLCVERIGNLSLAAQNSSCTFQLNVDFRNEGGVKDMTPEHIEQWIAIFLLVRGESATLLFPGLGDYGFAKDYPWHPGFDKDYGVPLQAAPELTGLVFSREWTKAKITLDCATFHTSITMKEETELNIVV